MSNEERRVMPRVLSLTRRFFKKTWFGVQCFFRYMYAERHTILLIAILGTLADYRFPDRMRCHNSSLQWFLIASYRETTPDYHCIERESASNFELVKIENQATIERAIIKSENSINKAEIDAQAQIEKARVEAAVRILEVAAPHLSTEELHELFRSLLYSD